MTAGDSRTKPDEQPQPPRRPSQKTSKAWWKKLARTSPLSVAIGVLVLGLSATQRIWYYRSVLMLSNILGPASSLLISQATLIDSRTTEIAHLMTDIYHTLAEMLYLDARGIVRGPHELSSLPSSLDLDPAIVRLYQRLPYIDTDEAGATDAILRTGFADFRRRDDVKDSRDPFHRGASKSVNATNGRYIQPWQTPLFKVSSSAAPLIVYDARQHVIWMLDQLSGGSADPALADEPWAPRTSSNQNDFQHIPSRSAGAVLRDIKAGLKSLTYVPGGGTQSDFGGLWDADAFRELYQTNGWPNHFDGDAFEVARARWYGTARARQNSRKPLDDVEKYEAYAFSAASDMRQRQRQLEAAESEDDEWLAKWEIFKLDRIQKEIDKDHDNANREVARLCPEGVCQREEDLPLWEAEQLRVEIEAKSAHIRSIEQTLISMRNESLPTDKKPSADEIKFQITLLHHARHDLSVYQKAHLEAQAEASRLRPNTSFFEATRIPHLQRMTIENEIAEARIARDRAADNMMAYEEWDKQSPQDATVYPKFRNGLLNDMGMLIRQHAGLKARWERAVAWKKEHAGGGEEDEEAEQEGSVAGVRAEGLMIGSR